MFADDVTAGVLAGERAGIGGVATLTLAGATASEGATGVAAESGALDFSDEETADIRELLGVGET